MFHEIVELVSRDKTLLKHYNLTSSREDWREVNALEHLLQLVMDKITVTPLLSYVTSYVL